MNFGHSLTGLILLIIPTLLWAQPRQLTMTYEGQLSDAGGQPVNASRAITLRLYEAIDDEADLWTETHMGVDIVDGRFTVVMGEINPLTENIADRRQLFLGIQRRPR